MAGSGGLWPLLRYLLQGETHTLLGSKLALSLPHSGPKRFLAASPSLSFLICEAEPSVAPAT